MRVKGAAFEPLIKAKIAATDTEGDDVCAITTSQAKNNKNSKEQYKQQTHIKTTAEMASISDTDFNVLAARLIALLRPSDTAATGAPSAAPPLFKGALWSPYQRTPCALG